MIKTSASPDLFRHLSSQKIPWSVGIRVYSQWCPCFFRHLNHVAVGQAVPFTPGEFQQDIFFGSQGCILFADKARMGKDIDSGFKGSPIGSWKHRFHRGFTVNDDQLCPQLSGSKGQGAYQGRGDMGQLNANDQLGLVYRIQITGRPKQVRDEQVNIGGVGMIGNGNGRVPEDFHPPDVFRRNKSSVAKKSMGMKIYHNNDFSMF